MNSNDIIDHRFGFFNFFQSEIGGRASNGQLFAEIPDDSLKAKLGNAELDILDLERPGLC